MTYKEMDKKYRPFSTGSQYKEWIERNCGSCRKRYDERYSKFRCDWERALCESRVLDGTIDEATAKAIGYLDNFAPGWTDPICTMWECPMWERGRG